MLTIRRRGKVYHIRGSVRVGGEIRWVKEHSTGCNRREDAEAYRSKLEHDVRQALLRGDGGKAQGLTIADAGLLYMNRPGGLKAYDLWRLDQLNDVIGDHPVVTAAEAWGKFKQIRCVGLAPAAVERFRGVLQAALNYAGSIERFEAPKVARTERLAKKRIRFLAPDQEQRLLSLYAPHVRPIAETQPAAELAPSCGANGVLGALPGIMGVLQAIEVVKLVTGAGDPLIGRLLLYEALGTTFTTLKLRRDPDCPICSRDPGEISDEEMGLFPDYEAFCAAAG